MQTLLRCQNTVSFCNLQPILKPSLSPSFVVENHFCASKVAINTGLTTQLDYKILGVIDLASIARIMWHSLERETV